MLQCDPAAGTRKFSWLDRTSPQSNAYSNWGTYMEGSTAQPEPNNRPAPQDCGVGNLSQVVVGVYGWADADCSLQLPFVCEINGTLVLPIIRASDASSVVLVLPALHD